MTLFVGGWVAAAAGAAASEPVCLLEHEPSSNSILSLIALVLYFLFPLFLFPLFLFRLFVLLLLVLFFLRHLLILSKPNLYLLFLSFSSPILFLLLLLLLFFSVSLMM